MKEDLWYIYACAIDNIDYVKENIDTISVDKAYQYALHNGSLNTAKYLETKGANIDMFNCRTARKKLLNKIYTKIQNVFETLDFFEERGKYEMSDQLINRYLNNRNHNQEVYMALQREIKLKRLLK